MQKIDVNVSDECDLSAGASVPIELKFGRVDDVCTHDNPINITADDPDGFPDPRLGFTYVTNWCKTAFGLNVRECVTLLGMYALLIVMTPYCH